MIMTFEEGRKMQIMVTLFEERGELQEIVEELNGMVRKPPMKIAEC